MKMTRVIIRADGNNEIGFGHIMRTRALASQLQTLGAEVIFLTKNTESVSGFETESVPVDLTCKQDAGYLADISLKTGAKLIIVDSYAVDQEVLDKIGTLEACSVYIDDLNQYEFDVDFVINGNLYAPRLDYQGKAQFLLGSDYLLMREEFGNVDYHFNKNPKNIMITFGAADTECVTSKIIEMIKDYDGFSELEWHVVIGPANIHGKKVLDSAKPYRNIHLYNNPNMKAVMENCDISIAASGSTVYELAACGVPSLLIITADNQLMLAEEAERCGFAINMGWHYTLSADILCKHIEELLKDSFSRQKMVRMGRDLIDGRGAKRAARILMANAVR